MAAGRHPFPPFPPFPRVPPFPRIPPFPRFPRFLRFLRSNANGQRLERDIGKMVLLERDGEKDGGLVERVVAVTKDIV